MDKNWTRNARRQGLPNNITFTGTGDSSNAGMCSAWSVVDTALPTISVSVTPSAKVPPNHEMFDVTYGGDQRHL